MKDGQPPVQQFRGMEYLAWSDAEPRRLIINFTSMNKGKFERWSWFHGAPTAIPSAYLFLRDETFCYYRGPSGDPKINDYLGLCKITMSQSPTIDAAQSIAIGSSMAGYAAVFYGLALNIGRVLTINPQVDMSSAQLHEYDNWTRQMAASDWQDLDDYVLTCRGRKTHIHLMYGDYAADYAAAQKLIFALQGAELSFSTEKTQQATHGWHGMSSDRLLKIWLAAP